jgi:hypothetical protein
MKGKAVAHAESQVLAAGQMKGGTIERRGKKDGDETRVGKIYREAKMTVSGLGPDTIERSKADFNAVRVKTNKPKIDSLFCANENSLLDTRSTEQVGDGNMDFAVTVSENTSELVYRCADCLKHQPRNTVCFPDVKIVQSLLNDENAEIIAEGLENNTYVMNVDLTGNHIRCAGVRALANAVLSTRIMGLYLGGNCIGDSGASALAESITKSSSLTELNLAGKNEAADERANVAFFPALSAASPSPGNTSTLTRRAIITQIGASSIAEALASSTTTLLSLCLSNSAIKE